MTDTPTVDRVAPAASPESEALRVFYPPGTSTWEGCIEPGMMPWDPDSPAMRAVGCAEVRWIMDGLWAVCDFEQDQFVDGTADPVLTWRAHWVAGWDLARQEYRAFAADSNGATLLFTGSIEDDVLIWDAASDSILGADTPIRMVQDASDPTAMPWRTEMARADGTWELVESYVVTPEPSADDLRA